MDGAGLTGLEPHLGCDFSSAQPWPYPSAALLPSLKVLMSLSFPPPSGAGLVGVPL